jgi:hypothetical protein
VNPASRSELATRSRMYCSSSTTRTVELGTLET